MPLLLGCHTSRYVISILSWIARSEFSQIPLSFQRFGGPISCSAPSTGPIKAAAYQHNIPHSVPRPPSSRMFRRAQVSHPLTVSILSLVLPLPTSPNPSCSYRSLFGFRFVSIPVSSPQAVYTSWPLLSLQTLVPQSPQRNLVISTSLSVCFRYCSGSPCKSEKSAVDTQRLSAKAEPVIRRQSVQWERAWERSNLGQY